MSQIAQLQTPSPPMVADGEFRSFAENLPTLCWMADAKGATHWYNRRWYEYTGSTPAELKDWGWQSFHDSAVLPSVLERWADSIATGLPFEMVFPLKRHDGQFLPFLTRIVPHRDADGTVVAWFGTNTDISEQAEVQRALRESETQFRMFAQAMPNQVWSSPPNGLLDWFNDRTYEYSGALQGELAGQNWSRMVHEDDIAAAVRTWAGCLASGAVYETEFRLRRADGIYRWHIARAVPVRSETGEITRWIGTNTDIEVQKTATEALEQLNARLEDVVAERTAELLKSQEVLRQSQKMEAIGNLTGGVAHDFNNLLQVVSGNLQLLSRDVIGNARAERRVQNAMSGVSRGAKLAAQLLAFGRRQPLAPKVVDIGRLVREMDDLLRRSLGEEVEVETVVAGGLWKTKVDPGNIENAILNLAINGRDAMNGVGQLTIEAGNASLDEDYAKFHPDITPGQYVLLAVTDTGGGMTADVLEKAFEPFFSTKPEGQGTGLGLSMVYGLMKQSGGHVKIYSEVGQGTTVKLYLPRSHEDEDVIVNPEADVAERGHETVLVVEDDDDVRETTVATLQDLGYKVLKANDAQSALHVIESGIAIDVLFTDVVMPGQFKSPDLARKAVQRLPDIVVLFTSGYTQNAIVHGGRLDKGVELLSKPYTREALAARLRRLLSERRSRTGAVQN